MKRRLSALLLALALAASLAGPALGAAGDASDPAVSLSYLDETFTAELKKTIEGRVHRGLGKTYRESLLSVTEEAAAARQAAQKAAAGTLRRAAGRVLCKQGDVLTLSPGCKVTLTSGTAEADTSYLVDVTHGRAVAKSSRLAGRTLYMMGDTDSGELRIRSATCELTLDGVYRLAPADGVDYGALAEGLHAMGLLSGTGSGYALENPTDRAQGLVMFLRILGLRDEAAAYTGSAPFRDVPRSHWAHNYVAYAYAKGLTVGTGADTFSPDRAMTCQQYATFLLRALHYREKTDFTYNTAVADLTALDLFSQAETAALSMGTFTRYKMVYLSYYSLYGVDNASGRLLMNELTAAGAVDEDALIAGLCCPVGRRLR